MEHFDLEQNDIDKLQTDSDKDINELNYIFSQDSDKCYLNFNEILYHYLKKNTSTHKLIDKYISLDKPKNFDNKRTNNLKGSTSGNTLNNLKSDSLTRDKNRKFSSKPSNDKYLKSKDTSNALINMSSNLSSK